MLLKCEWELIPSAFCPQIVRPLNSAHTVVFKEKCLRSKHLALLEIKSRMLFSNETVKEVINLPVCSGICSRKKKINQRPTDESFAKGETEMLQKTTVLS